MLIIDAHAHLGVYPEFGVKMNVREMVEIMDQYAIRASLVSSIPNDVTLEATRLFLERIFGLIWVNPYDSHDGGAHRSRGAVHLRASREGEAHRRQSIQQVVPPHGWLSVQTFTAYKGLRRTPSESRIPVPRPPAVQRPLAEAGRGRRGSTPCLYVNAYMQNMPVGSTQSSWAKSKFGGA